MSARLILLPALVVLGIGRSALSADSGAESFSPEKYEISRYKNIWERSPFIVETKVDTPSAGLAARYTLVGLVQSGDDSVAFLNEGGKTVMISKKRPDRERNLELVSIMADKDFRKSKVTIRQGDEKAELTFDPSAALAMGSSSSVDVASTVPPPPTGVINTHYVQPRTANGAVAPVPATPGAQTSAQRRIISSGAPAMPTAPNTGAATPSQSTVNPATGALPPVPTRRIIRPKPIDVSN